MRPPIKTSKIASKAAKAIAPYTLFGIELFLLNLAHRYNIRYKLTAIFSSIVQDSIGRVIV